MKGIALIRRQIGHLDSVWFLMPDDSHVPLSFSLSASRTHSAFHSLLGEHFLSTLSPLETYMCDQKIQEISEGMKKKKHNTRLFLCFHPIEIN